MTVKYRIAAAMRRGLQTYKPQEMWSTRYCGVCAKMHVLCVVADMDR